MSEMNDVEKKIHEFFREEVLVDDDEPLDAQTALIEEGYLDSISFFRLSAYIEDTFGVAIAEDDMSAENFGSIREIAEYVKKQRD